MITSWISHGFDKVLGDAAVPAHPKTSYKLYLAKNESEGVHLSFLSEESVQKLSLTVEGAYLGLSCKVYTETYIPVRSTLFPDPLVPCDGTFAIAAHQPTNVLIDFTASKAAPAGDAVYTVTVKTAEGCVVGVYPITVHIWSFALPDTPACETAVQIQIDYLKKYHNPADDADLHALYKAYYDTLLDHKISAYSLPYDILDARADAYMSDPRVTSFCATFRTAGIYETEDDIDKLRAIGQKLAQNPAWQHKAYTYPLDEPVSMAHLEQLREKSAFLREQIPGIHQVVPFYVNIDVDESTDQIAFMAPLHDVWCPKAQLFREVYTEEQAKKYPPFCDRMKAFQASGDRVWWYVCNYPQPPYLNVFTNDIGLHSRALFWQQYRCGVTGFLYWSSTCWRHMDDPWEDTDTFGNDIHGDGILFYPGEKVGMHGPITSLRLKIIRDGIEDFDLFTLAEQVLGREALLEKILSVTPSLVEVAADGDTFCAVRAEIGCALEAALENR